MALPMFTRFGNMRNVMNINNISAIGGALNVKQCSNIISRSYTNSSKEIETLFDDIYEENSDKNMSKAMRIYLQRTREHTKFIEVETLKYELGKRHLANMMGEDPAHFEQEDIDRALQYLLPSGIYDKRARPMMVHPSKIFENKKEAQFDESGRPFHFLYYTCKPNYYEVLRKIAEAIKYLDAKEDEYIEKRRQPLHQNKLDMENTCWITKTAIEAELLEELQPSEYEYLIKCLDRLVEHPMSIHKTDFIMQYRKELQISTQSSKILALEYDSNDRPFVLVPKCKRKCALANVKVIGKGSGNIIINGKDISYFRNVQYREEVSL